MFNRDTYSGANGANSKEKKMTRDELARHKKMREAIDRGNANRELEKKQKAANHQDHEISKLEEEFKNRAALKEHEHYANMTKREPK